MKTIWRLAIASPFGISMNFDIKEVMRTDMNVD